MIVIQTACKSAKEARKIAEVLVKEKLAACVSISPVESIYRWKGKIKKAKEVLLVIKTQEGLAKKVTSTVKKLNSYEIPEIMAFQIAGGSKSYLGWLKKETS